MAPRRNELAIKRILKESKDMIENPPSNCSAGPLGRDIFSWGGTIVGPVGTPYAGGIFNLSIYFPQEYPIKPPAVKFLTKVYHPNINREGSICLDILDKTWSPALSLQAVLISICSLLSDPNPDHPFELEIAMLYKRNIAIYESTARSWTQKYAM